MGFIWLANREVKHDVCGKRQNWNFCCLSSAVCTVEWDYLYLQWIVGNGSPFLCFRRKELEIRSPFCRLPLCLTSLIASSVSGQDESNPVLWLATRASKTALSCPLGTTCRVPQGKFHFPESHIINPLLTKFVRSRWLDMATFFFCEFMDWSALDTQK